MRLSEAEERMLAGKEGEAIRLSMEVLMQIGDSYGAKRLLPINSVHAGVGFPRFRACGDMVEKFANLGGRFRTFTTVNPNPRQCNFGCWGAFQESEMVKQEIVRQNTAIEKMGVCPTWSCTPYFEGNLPRLGEPVSWVESSAITFANSVLGARTNRTTMGVDVASAITGRVPEFGLLLKNERAGNARVKMKFQPRSMFDFSTVGFLIGKLCNGGIPVIEGLPTWTTANELKAMGAAAATSGGIALFHAVGITPEATTRSEAFQGHEPEFEVSIEEHDVKEAEEELTTASANAIDAVLLGCPFPSVSEVKEVAELLSGKKVSANIFFCLFASSTVAAMSRQMGYVDAIEAAGGKVIEGECFASHSIEEWGWKNIATNSAKCASIMAAGPTYLNTLYTDTKGCVGAAVG